VTEESSLYSPEAEEQLDALQVGSDAGLYNAVLDAIDHVLDHTDEARVASPPLRDAEGRPIRATVVTYELQPRWFVFWAERPAGVVVLGVGELPAF
jgi:hypothetical protein